MGCGGAFRAFAAFGAGAGFALAGLGRAAFGELAPPLGFFGRLFFLILLTFAFFLAL
ncbi:MAG TPA: hypothetical protein VFS00_06055 [Polyangiaceae bacterium]|nr:hypothetical protein [Polyangiaceae bacterium]